MTVVEWARRHAAELLAELPTRWVHTQAVAHRAGRIGHAMRSTEARGVLVAAAYLHDIGYASSLKRTGFHPLHGALHLREVGIAMRTGIVLS